MTGMPNVFSRFAAFATNRSGAGAVEFALIVPVLLILYVGGVDVTRAVIFSHKLQNATTAVNDVIGQMTELSRADVETSFAVADKMLAQYRATPIGIRVTAIEIASDGSADILWSVARGLPPASPGSDFELPSRLLGHHDFTLLVTETEHAFQPILTYVVQEAIPLSAKAQGRFRGRNSTACLDCSS